MICAPSARPSIIQYIPGLRVYPWSIKEKHTQKKKLFTRRNLPFTLKSALAHRKINLFPFNFPPPIKPKLVWLTTTFHSIDSVLRIQSHISRKILKMFSSQTQVEHHPAWAQQNKTMINSHFDASLLIYRFIQLGLKSNS